MFEPLKQYLDHTIAEFDQISADRKKTLGELADYIRSKQDRGETARLNFICTHNSRRSHLAQIWTAVAAYDRDLEHIETYSGGTEATAFNPRAVAALERAGLRITNPGGSNPRYEVHYSDHAKPLICYSKTYDDPVNPSSGFAALMTCSDADENCPFVPGNEFRVAITYRDPKESDGIPNEKQTYDERCRQIAREMFWMVGQV